MSGGALPFVVMEMAIIGGEMVQWPKYFYPLILMKIGGWIEYH